MTTFKHSGAMGDVIYSLPSIACLADDTAALFLQADLPDSIPAWAGERQNVRMTRAQCESLLPLLRSQPLFSEVEVWDGRAVEVDLDRFREAEFDFTRWSIARYYSLVWPAAQPELDLPWLSVEPSGEFKDMVILNRTQRYRAAVSYRFLAGRSDVVFVGTGDEYRDFTKDCPRIPHAYASDALELARWVAGCRLMLGNASFAFSLAEAMKTPRCLEGYARCCNVIPEGPGAAAFFSQSALEQLFEALCK